MDAAAKTLSPVTPMGRIACGANDGEIHFIELRNYTQAEPRVTGTKDVPLPTSTKSPAVPWTTCPWCKQPMEMQQDVIEVIGRYQRLAAGGPPCLMLPCDAWNDSRLLAECPHCGGRIRFNPFYAMSGISMSRLISGWNWLLSALLDDKPRGFNRRPERS
jgi:hypothetical protein